MEVKIRPFELDDMEELLDIEVSNFPKDAYNKAHFLMWYTTLPETFLVAELKKVVGYILISKENEHAQLISVAVLPGYKRQGIGSKLLHAGIEAVKKQTAKKVEAESRVSNKIAHKFFAKHKFKKIKTVKHYYEDGEDAIKFEKEI
ncbi:ribosomal-protein-alanine N-acetyltransferase [Candidatus Woesearchaeota archaeon]|nr:ribosomal-protein-alanine N-acetyltransferase [Candidatus Woesearchaeota archaeon]